MIMNECKEPRAVDLEEGWAFIQKGIKKLKNLLEGREEEPLNSRDYSNCYTTIYNICIENSPVVDYRMQEMYDKYKEILEEHINTMVLPALRQNHGEFLLRELLKGWANHKIMVRWLSRFFGYLDRFFTRRKILPNLNEVGRTCFLHQVYEETKHDIKDAMITLIDREREGEQADHALLKNVLGFYVEIFMGNMDAYENHFELAMLTDTAAYYSRKAVSWIGEYSFPDYMVKTEDCLKKEKERVGNYLHGSSEPKLLEVVQHELLIQLENQLLEKDDPRCQALLSDDKHIINEGTTLVKQAKDATINKKAEDKDAHSGQDQAFVKKVVELHDKYLLRVRECFVNNAHFMKALKEAFELICNKGIAGHTSPELFATICDDLLMKGDSERLSHQDIDGTIEKVVKVLAYISDKDLFAEFYRKKLAGRLLSFKSVNEDREVYILTQLKERLGGLFTSKMDRMVTDLVLSRESRTSFEDYLRDNSSCNPGIQLNMTLLTTVSWPEDYRYLNLPLPAEMVKCVEVFNKFYQTTTQGRKLTWICSLGTCALNVQFDSKPMELIVTTYQTAVLLLFNEAERLTYADIKGQFNLGDETITRLLHSLSCGKHKILNKNPSTKTVRPTDSFEFNSKFTSKMRSIKIPLPPMDERKKFMADVEKERPYVVDACIVRIMKSRKICHYQKLLLESIDQLEQNFKFKPDSKFIKKCIDDLIYREYLERDIDNPNVFKYLA